MHCHRCKGRAACRAGPRQQRGAALVVAMLVFALTAALAVAMQGDFQRFVQRTSNLLVSEQAHAYLRGAEDLAALVLQRDWDEDKQEQLIRDDFTELWAQESQPFPLDDRGWLRAAPLEDLQGRFNLNSLAAQARQEGGVPKYTPEQEQFIRLLQALDGPDISQFEAAAITLSVSDWLDSDSSVLADGAEDDYYGALTPAYRAANRAMGSVSELRAVANVTPEIYLALAPYVTVWPREPEPINIHTAPGPVLRSINARNDLNPLSAADAEALVEIQRGEGFVDKAAFLANPVFAGKELGDIRGLLGERSSWFLLSVTVELADRNTHLYSVLQRKNRRVKAVVRAGGSL
ncbi:MAG: type II secretion system minor pseudopilin GspK [Halioglobus sp.]|nr:type II secretion system minor pseudopilin GspK [Halioglobus sp.]